MATHYPPSFDVMLATATNPMAVDEEIHAEVRRELLSHLVDDYKARLDSGRSYADAEREALAAFGEPTDVARQLYQAHRSRIAQRKVARWAMRLGVAPGAVALLVYFSAQIYLSLAVLVGLITVSFQPISGSDARARDVYVSRAPTAAVARFIRGAESAADNVAWLRPLAAERPENLALQRQLALARAYPVFNGPQWRSNWYPDRPAAPLPTADELARAFAILDEAKISDPGNGLYALVQASVLFRLSVEPFVPASDTQEPVVEWTDIYPYGKRFWAPEPYRVANPVLFEKGLAHLRELDTAQFIDSGAKPLGRLWEDLAPSLSTLADRQARRQLEQRSFNSWSPMASDVLRGTEIAYARNLRSNPAQAKANAQQLAHLSRLISKGEPDEEELGQARLFYFSSLTLQAYLASEMKDHTAFDQISMAKLELDAANRLDIRIFVAMRKEAAGGKGITDPYRLDPPPADVTRAGLQGEYAMLDRFAVLVLAGTLFVGTVVMWLTRRDFTFKYLPRGRDALQLTVATLAPAGLYLAASYLFPALRDSGLARTWPRVLAEYALIGLTTFLLLIFTLRSVLRRQGKRLSLNKPHLLFGLLLLLGSAILISHWLLHPWTAQQPISLSELPVYLTLLLLLSTLVYLIWTALRLLKSSPAYLLIPAFALLLLLTPTLRLIELHALNQSTTPTHDLFPNLKLYLRATG